MHNYESVANYFLHVYEIVKCMKNLGEEIKEDVVVEKVLRSLSPRFESRVSAIEEKENLQNLTMSQLHGILTAYEMRKGGPSNRREATFKALGKGYYYEPRHVPEKRRNQILSRIFNEVLEYLEVRYLSNALLVEGSVTMLPNVLIRIRLTRGRNLLDGTRNKM